MTLVFIPRSFASNDRRMLNNRYIPEIVRSFHTNYPNVRVVNGKWVNNSYELLYPTKMYVAWNEYNLA